MQIFRQQLGHLARGTALTSLKLPDGFGRTAHLLRQAFLREVQRLPALLEPFTKRRIHFSVPVCPLSVPLIVPLNGWHLPTPSCFNEDVFSQLTKKQPDNIRFKIIKQKENDYEHAQRF